jgi:hypothetical protein
VPQESGRAVSPGLALAIVAAVVGAAWYVRIRLYPWKDCPRCDGGRRIARGVVHRDCGRCGATGRVRRLGAPREDR